MKNFLCFVPFFFLGGCIGQEKLVVAVNSCSIDTPAMQVGVSGKSDFMVGGWFFDKQTSNASEKLLVQITSRDRKVIKVFDAEIKGNRGDVANVFGDAAAATSGFNTIVPVGSLVVGDYDVTLIRDTRDVKVVCRNNNSFKITE